MKSYEMTVYKVGKKRPLIDLPDSIWWEIERDYPSVRHVATGRYRSRNHGDLAMVLNRYWDSRLRYMRIDKIVDNHIYEPGPNGPYISGHYFELRIYDRKRGYVLTDLKKKDMEEIQKRWPQFQHCGTGIYRYSTNAVGAISTYFGNRNYSMYLREHGGKKEKTDVQEIGVTELGKRTILTYFKDAFRWDFSAALVIFGLAYGIVHYLTFVVVSVFSFVIIIVYLPLLLCFLCASIAFLFNFVAVTVMYVVEPLGKMIYKTNGKKDNSSE